MFSVLVQEEPISLDAPASPDRNDTGEGGVNGSGAEQSGAQVRFIGKVREADAHAPLSHLVLEHFPEVTEAEIERIVAQARDRWPLQAARVIHRVGRIALGEVIVLVETSAAHRREAYDANMFIMDFLKTEAPFWKQECFEDGSSRWVAARDKDAQAASSWNTITAAENARTTRPHAGKAPAQTTLSHFNARGQAHMVDVGGKPVTHRTAVARGSIRMSPDAFAATQGNDKSQHNEGSGDAGAQSSPNSSVTFSPKGDVFGVARIAAIQGAKQTSTHSAMPPPAVDASQRGVLHGR